MSAKRGLTHIAYKIPSRGLLDVVRVMRRHLSRKIGHALILRRNRKVIDLLLQGGEPILLELGAGERRLKGWTTIDRNEASDICMDLLNPLPFPDNCVTQVYCSHLLEHFYYPDLVSLLSECYRVLEPSGLFKVAVPNARIYLEAYADPEGFDDEYYCRYGPAFHYNSRIDYVNYMAYMGGYHRYLFDEENLLIVLANAGFACVRLRGFDPSLDLEQREYETIYAEAVKFDDRGTLERVY